MTNLGEYLRTIREKKHLSLGDVYLKTGITDSRMSNLENNKYDEPSPALLKQVADFYDISIVDLYVRAGYLSFDDLDYCSHIFKGLNKLSEKDIAHIQGQIDYLISCRGV
ncbi:MAG: helix-turn-helix transcriptional regulator [Ruminococcus sp.]|nr:helix-turn-helix transcriptional regulator [Ruminococcus sp.]